MKGWQTEFSQVIDRLGEVGARDIEWSENAGPPKNAEDFAAETIFVICNSGMKHTVARGIFNKVMRALVSGQSSNTAFGHKGKCAAINQIWETRAALYGEFMATPEVVRVEWLETLPWIGPITKFHLAKNFGVDCVKPDVHLARLAAAFETTPDEMCAEIAAELGYKKRTIDALIWRACATGVINSRTGALASPLTSGGEG